MEPKPLHGYLIYPDGRIWSNVRRKFVKQKQDKRGYMRVWFSEDGKQKWRLVHRLVATAFYGESQLPQVNHMDGDKTNNHFQNLEWCTSSHNIRHSLATGLASMDKLQAHNEKIRKVSREVVALADMCQRYGMYSFQKLAELIGVHTMTIHDAIKRRRARLAA